MVMMVVQLLDLLLSRVLVVAVLMALVAKDLVVDLV